MPIDQSVIERTRERLGEVGVWLGPLATLPVLDEQRTVAVLENLGYGSIFFGEVLAGKEAFSHFAALLAATERVIVGSGIANIWARQAATMTGGARTTGAAWPGRVVLGIGVSHAPIVVDSGQRYERPLEHMRAYLDAMDAAGADAPTPAVAVPRLLAALRPKMLELAAKRADGAHPYFVPVAHTRLAREVLGPDKLLVTEQAVILTSEPATAQATARAHLERYLRLPNYVNNLRHLGYGDVDLEGGGSDRLVEDLVVIGDEEAVVERVRQHRQAGADHVVLQALGNPPEAIAQLERLAPAFS